MCISFARKVLSNLTVCLCVGCGHCKQAKPEFMAAAEKLKDELRIVFGAVDCTQHQALCSSHDVKGYPTFKYFMYYNKGGKDYTGGRKVRLN